jgi:hypothetical protein
MRFRAWAVAVVVAAFIGSLTSAGASSSQPGSFKISTALGCQAAPECAAFLSVCDSSVATRDGVTSSVVDVSALRGDSAIVRAQWVTLGPQAALNLQFLSASCAQVSNSVLWHPGTTTVVVPVSTRWLAITGAFAENVVWSIDSQA